MSDETQQRFAGGSANYMIRHLIGVATAVRAGFGQEVQARGHIFTPPMTQLIVNLPVDGLGMSELAARLRLTLQRTGQVVAQLEEAGYVQRVPDEHDGRAKRVVFTERGRKLVDDIDEVDRALTDELAKLLGKKRFERLCQDLEALDQAVTGDDDVLKL